MWTGRPSPIAFRVEAEFADESSSTPGFDREQNLSSRGPQVLLTEYTAMLHLTWKRYWPRTRYLFNSPFISLFTSYQSARRRKDWFLGEGATRVIILAYDVSEMTTLFDARKLAFHLGLKLLQFYEHELLAVSKIVADDYSLLAVMPATSGWEIQLTTPWGLIAVPEEYWTQHCYSRNPLEALRLELYSHTGWRCDRRLDCLANALKI
jgi:hypothetical protein